MRIRHVISNACLAHADDCFATMEALMTAYRHASGQGDGHELPGLKDPLRLNLVHTHFRRAAHD